MQASPSLAEFLARLDEGPRGADEALAAIDKCAAGASPLLDLQQMELTDKDLQLIAPKLSALSPHVKELNLFMNECVSPYVVTDRLPRLFSSVLRSGL